MNNLDIWKDGPSDSEFIVEFVDGEIHYYRHIQGVLEVFVRVGSVIFVWTKSKFESTDEVVNSGEWGIKHIHFK